MYRAPLTLPSHCTPNFPLLFVCFFFIYFFFNHCGPACLCQVKFYSKRSEVVIIRVDHRFRSMVQACLSLLNSIDGFAVAISTVHVSGTIDCFCNRLGTELIGSVHTWDRPFIASNDRPTQHMDRVGAHVQGCRAQGDGESNTETHERGSEIGTRHAILTRINRYSACNIDSHQSILGMQY